MKVILCGDLTPTEATAPAYDAGDLQTLFGGAADVIRKGDFAVLNLECALTERETPIRKCGPNLKAKPEYAQVLAKIGFTHAGLSNNHVWDFGEMGMRDTVESVRSAGMTPFGFGENDQDSRKPVFLKKDGKTLAVVAVCEHEYCYALPDRFGANPFDPFDTMEDIALAKAQADWVIVMYHGGKEQCEYPSPRLRKACRAMVRAGADLVVCQHSHCIGCHEDYRGGQIVYGEGNFNFLMNDHPHWKTGLMMEITLEEKVSVQYWPLAVHSAGVDLARGEEAEKILFGFEERSDFLKDEAIWLSKWEAFCHTMPYYEAAMKNAFADVPEGERCHQTFPHYLDCEAHLDVLKTLYKTWHGEKRAEGKRE